MCGIFGVFYNVPSVHHANQKAHVDICRGLKHLQHRGQDGFGVSWKSTQPPQLQTATYNGCITKQSVQQLLSRVNDACVSSAIGHTRYSTVPVNTTESVGLKHDARKYIQPFQHIHPQLGEYVLCHNGHMAYFDDQYDLVQPLSDTQLFVQWIQNIRASSWEDLFSVVLDTISSAFCLLILTQDALFAVRDKYGIHPLCIGWNHDGYAVSSESCALDKHLFMGMVECGEVAKISHDTTGYVCCTRHVENKVKQMESSLSAHCLFESIYFASSKSTMNGECVADFRRVCGEALYRMDCSESFWEQPHRVLICGLPNSGIVAGKGYAHASNIPYQQVLIKSPHYTKKRTFILENNEQRKQACKDKFMIHPMYVNKVSDAIVILIDDSVVRGNTMASVISLFVDAGAMEIHIRVASPPIVQPCHKGIHIAKHEEFIYWKVHSRVSEPRNNNRMIEAIAQELNATSIKYLSNMTLKHIRKQTGGMGNVCEDCFHCDHSSLSW